MMKPTKRYAILFALLAISLTAAAQDITVKATDRPAAEVFRTIMQQTDRNFVYSSELLKDMRITVDVKKKPLKKVLDDIFRGTDIEYRIKGKNVVLKRKKTSEPKKTVSTPRKDPATHLHISDSVRITMLQTVDVVSQSDNHPLETAKLGTNTLSGATIARTPAFLGERDVVKALQILPGVSEATEGVAGINVHGGNPDENMVMLDNVPFYQAEHFAGLFSPFNADLVRSADFYKTSIPGRFDGRLSSFLDIHMKHSSRNGHHGSAKLGLTSGAFDISGPIGDRTTYLVGLRRSWFDVLTIPILAVVNASNHSEKIRLGYHFMDFNARISHRFSQKAEAFVNFYYGDDLLQTGEKDKKKPTSGFYYEYGYDFNWGNILTQAGLDFKISPTLTSRFSAAYTRYFNLMKTDDIEKEFLDNDILTSRSRMKNSNNIDDITLSGDFTLCPTEDNTFRFGASYSWHSFLPDRTTRENIYDNITITSREASEAMTAHQAEAYAEDDWRISERLLAEAGIHASLFHIDRKTKGGISPRFALSFNPTSSLALKAAYSRTVQYVHRIDQTYLSLPCDRWIPTSGNFKPMTADKIGIGGYWQTEGGDYAVTLEGYWKWMHNILDYRDEFYLHPASWSWSNRLTSGKGDAKGIDLMIEKKTGRLTGHLSYSLAWADRQFADRNDGHKYPARFDHRHTVKVFANWDISPKVSLSALWTGHSGNRFTFMPQRYEGPKLPGASHSFYSSWDDKLIWSSTEALLKVPVNNYQLPFYHRLDLSLTVRNRRGYWTFGLYNAYCNMNTVAIVTGYTKGMYKVIEEDGYSGVSFESKPTFQKFRLLPLIPSISYTWQF